MQAGDGTAVADLASTYGPRIQQLAFRYLKNWEDAEEVDPGRSDEGVPEDRCVPRRRGAVFLDLPDHVQHRDVAAAHRRASAARRSADAGPCDDRVARARASRSRRTGRRWPTIRCMRAEMRKRLIDALTHLPTVYRVPVMLRDIQGLSTEEASAVLRVKPQTLKSRLHRGTADPARAPRRFRRRPRAARARLGQLSRPVRARHQHHRSKPDDGRALSSNLASARPFSNAVRS